MPSEAVIERMIVQLVGDGRSYRQMITEARNITRDYTRQIGSLWRNAAGQMITSQKKMQAELFVTRDAMIKSSMAMRVFGQEVARAGKSMSLYLTAPLVAMGAASIKFGSDFESGFAGVRKTVDATEPEFAKLNQEFRDLAATIPVSAEELLRIGEIAGQLGIETGSIIEFTRTIAELSVTTNLTAEHGAEALARLANITGMSQDKFHNLGSAIVALGNKFPATEHEIAEMSMRIAAAGSTVGLAVPEITALATALTSVGIKSEMGGSAISRMMLQVTRDIATGSETIDRFAQISGMSTEKFKASWRENVGKTLLTFLSGLRELDAEAAAVALEELELDGIRLHQTMLSSANAVDKFTQAMYLANVSFEENIALTEEADKRFATFASAVQLLRNQVKLLGTELYDSVRPVLIEIVRTLESLTISLRGWSDEMKVAVIVAGSIVAAMGPFLLITGSLVAAVGQLRLAFLFIKPAMLAVFGLPGLGQALLVIGLVVVAIREWDAITESLGVTFGSFMELVTELKVLFEQLLVTVTPLIDIMGKELVRNLENAMFVLRVVIYMLKEVVETAQVAVDAVNNLGNTVFTGPMGIDPGPIFKPKETKGAGRGNITLRTDRPTTPSAVDSRLLRAMKAPSVTPINPEVSEQEAFGKELTKALERVQDTKAKFEEELAKMQMSERDYLIRQLEREREKGVLTHEMDEVLEAYDKLQEVKKQAAAIEKEEKLQKGINDEIKALRDQRAELQLGERAFLAFKLAREGASKAQIKAALGIYDEVQALEELKEKQEEDAKAAEEAKEAHDKFRDSIQRTVEATGAGLSAIIAREEARARRPEDPKNLEEEKEKKKLEAQKQGQLAEKAVAQGMKIFEVLRKIEENTSNATGSGPIIQPANIGE